MKREEVLKQGITGFFSKKNLPKSNYSYLDFKKTIYALGTVLECDDNTSGTFNYYYALIEIEGEMVGVVCNAIYGYYALAKPRDNAVTLLSFISVPTLEDKLVELSSTIINPQILELKIKEEDLINLSEAELREVKRWKPCRIGEIVFNCWD